MAISFVQSAVNATGSGTSLIVTLGGAATVRNFFVLHMKFGTNVTNISVTDNSGGSNAYAKALEQVSGGIDAYQFYGVQTTGGATTVTISWTTATSARIIVDEYSGGATTNATLFDKVAANTGTGTSGTVPISPTNAGELIAVGYLFGTAGTFAAGTNYTAAQSGTNASSQYRLVGTTSETAPASWTNSVAWIGIAGAYRPAFAFVQTTTNATASGTSLVMTLSGAATVNNLLVINMKFTSAPGAITVTDNSGVPNTYAQAATVTGTGVIGMQWYGVQITGSATTVTVSWVNTTASRIIVDEFSGNATTNATVFDKSATNTGTGTSGSGTLAPSANDELISAGYLFGAAGTFVAGTNYTASTANTNGSAEYRLCGTTSETMPASWTSSVNWVLVAGAYKRPAVVSSTGNTGAWGGNSKISYLGIANIGRI